jgi:hypothetical protein
VLKFADGKGAIAGKGDRRKAIYRQVIGMVVVMMILSFPLMVVIMVMVAITMVVIAVGMIGVMRLALAPMKILIGFKQPDTEN